MPIHLVPIFLRSRISTIRLTLKPEKPDLWKNKRQKTLQKPNIYVTLKGVKKYSIPNSRHPYVTKTVNLFLFF